VEKQNKIEPEIIVRIAVPVFHFLFYVVVVFGGGGVVVVVVLRSWIFCLYFFFSCFFQVFL
jgi:hypothetical protein